NAPSGPVAYSSGGSCSNSRSTLTMTTATFTFTVKYDHAGIHTFPTRRSSDLTVNAGKVDQSISVTVHAPSSAVYGSQFTVAANALGGPDAYSSVGCCSNSGATFTMNSATGTCTVKYDQAGNSNYKAAPEVTET